jgi:hypothetical protein
MVQIGRYLAGRPDQDRATERGEALQARKETAESGPDCITPDPTEQGSYGCHMVALFYVRFAPKLNITARCAARSDTQNRKMESVHN